MALVSVEGTYENGEVHLSERPEGIERARVLVTFLPTEENGADAAARRREAGSELLALMERGIDFGGTRFRRQELYGERAEELERRRAGH